MNRYKSAACFAIAILVALGSVNRLSAQHQVPFKGIVDGSFTVTPVTPPFIVDVLLKATGKATHLGQFTLVFPHRVNRSTTPALALGSCTFTAANGDQVFANVTGQSTPLAPGILQVVENGTISGGTGRFTGASGQFVVDRMIDQSTLTTIGSFEGTISRNK